MNLIYVITIQHIELIKILYVKQAKIYKNFLLYNGNEQKESFYNFSPFDNNVSMILVINQKISIT